RVDRLPVEAAGGVELDSRSEERRVGGDVDRAGVLRAQTAGRVGVDGVGDRAAGIGGGTGQAGRVVDGVADRAGRLRQGGRDRRAVRADHQLLTRAEAGGAVVVAVARVDRLPVEAAGGVELDS